MAGMPGKISKSGNEWSLEEIPAEEEILAGRGGSPEEALGGRGGGRWAAGEGGWVAPGNPPGEPISPPGGLRGGDHARCAKWHKTEPKS